MKKLITTAALFLALAFNVKANDLPRKEYPRPQFEREDWINLNGTWTFDFDFGQSGVDRQLQNSEKFSKNIIVPFCPESELSGVKHTDFINCMWYQRKISIPANWIKTNQEKCLIKSNHIPACVRYIFLMEYST